MSKDFRHLLTFDIEHWYEGYIHRGLGGWEGLPPRDPVVVEKLLELLAQYKQSATFFVTGKFAREFPSLVKSCCERGHEVASHSDVHRAIYHMGSRSEFRDDLQRSLDTLTGITGRQAFGFRAPKWSITRENKCWVLCEVVDAGLMYDSSFSSVQGHDCAGDRGWPLRIELSGGRFITEIPATGLAIGPITLPATGGFYLRAFPVWIATAMLTQKSRLNIPGIIYLHPYDLCSHGDNIFEVGLLFKIFRSYGVKSAWKKLEILLANHRFESIGNMLGLLPG